MTLGCCSSLKLCISLKSLNFFYCMYLMLAHVSLYASQTCRSQQKALESPETGVIGSCEPPCRYWELNPGFL